MKITWCYSLRVFGCIMLKLRGTPCIFKSAGVPGEFRENSGTFGEKTVVFFPIFSRVVDLVTV